MLVKVAKEELPNHFVQKKGTWCERRSIFCTSNEEKNKVNKEKHVKVEEKGMNLGQEEKVVLGISGSSRKR